MANQKEPKNIQFSSVGPSIAGVIGGVAIAIGVPWVFLTHGQLLNQSTLTIICIGAVALGGIIGLTATFFGLAMPQQMGNWGDPAYWEEFKKNKKR